MAFNKQYKVLYFVNSGKPTVEQREIAAHFGPNCGFRNALHIREEHNVEDCTAVYGEVPPQYAARFPWAVSYTDYLTGKLSNSPMAAKAPAVAADAPPDSGAGDPATFDPFASVPLAGRAGAAPNWKAQG